jgi:hypothetical protein
MPCLRHTWATVCPERSASSTTSSLISAMVLTLRATSFPLPGPMEEGWGLTQAVSGISPERQRCVRNVLSELSPIRTRETGFNI